MERTKEFLEYKYSAPEKRKGKIANVLSIVVLFVAVFVCVGFISGNSALIIALAAVNLLFGPVTLFFYLREVKRGVFKADIEDATD